MLQTEAIRAAIAAVLGARPEAVVIGPDVGAHGGPYRATSGLVERFGAERVLDMPRNASAIFGIARGLALAGRDVICEVAPEDAARMASTLARDAASWVGQQRRMSDAMWDRSAAIRPLGAPGAIVMRLPVLPESDVEGPLLGANGAAVWAPARPVDAFHAICHGVGAAGTVTFVLEHEALYRGHGAPLPESDLARAPHDSPAPEAWRVVREGEDLRIVTWGAGVAAAWDASERLAAEGCSVGVVDVGCLSALAPQSLEAAVLPAGRAVVAAPCGLTFAEALAGALTRAAFLSLEAPVAVVALHGSAPNQLVDTARETIEF
jgi:pyruvate/2-oxoglutarate/acetoin dehydrogenase E1 component